MQGRALGLVFSVLVMVGSGCYAEATDAIPPPDYSYGYAPVYYDGYVVDYDETGRPFYYVNGAVVWVPQTSPLYPGLVAHWHAFGPAYHDWHAHVGARYQGFRFHGHGRR
jgi:hypothetical protein